MMLNEPTGKRIGGSPKKRGSTEQPTIEQELHQSDLSHETLTEDDDAVYVLKPNAVGDSQKRNFAKMNRYVETIDNLTIHNKNLQHKNDELADENQNLLDQINDSYIKIPKTIFYIFVVLFGYLGYSGFNAISAMQKEVTSISSKVSANYEAIHGNGATDSGMGNK